MIRKLGTLAELSEKLDTDRAGVIAWAKEQARIETAQYKREEEARTVVIPFHADRLLEYHCQKTYNGGYLFLQTIYYGLKLDRTCQKIKEKYRFEYDINAILSDLIYKKTISTADYHLFPEICPLSKNNPQCPD